MSDRIARVFVDSNYRTNVEDSHGNFSIDLPLGVLVEAGSHLRVEGLVVSHVLPTLDVRNSYIFLREVVEEGTTIYQTWPLSCRSSCGSIPTSPMASGQLPVVTTVY